MEISGRLDRGDGVELAWSKLPGKHPTVVFLPGFASDMQGAKAVAIRDYCAEIGQACLRLDYSGHGVSGGAFTDGTIERWTRDAAAVIGVLTEGPVVLIGSSMGGWIGLLMARKVGNRVAGFIGIAAAPDFTEKLMWASMTPAEQHRLMAEGSITIASEYGEPLVLTRALIEDGRNHLLLNRTIEIVCPVRLLQGKLDRDVPWETAIAIGQHLASTDVQITWVEDGDHRLSRPEDIALLTGVLGKLLGQDSGQA